MLSRLLKRLLGSRHQRVVKTYQQIVETINRLEESYQKLTDDALKRKTEEFRQRLRNSESSDDLLPEAYAVVKNSCRRLLGSKIDVTGHSITWDMIPYDVQLIGGIALHRGSIAEMQTGEGKTLVAILPLYLNALTGRNCQLVTVNDYLARRDSQWVGYVLKWLGLSVGCIQNNMDPKQRCEQYACDITYGTNSEFGFDYLRDMGMASGIAEIVQRNHFFVIIDEIDSILVDEARTPLIISGPVAESTHRYDLLKTDIAQLMQKQTVLCTQLLQETKNILDDKHADKTAIEDVLGKLMRVKLGMPKHKRLLRILEDPSIRRQLERKDLEFHSDQNRAALQELKDTLYFSIDEKAHDADLSELGRRTLRPNDTESFILPDLAAQFQELEANTELNDREKQEQRKPLQQNFDERSETIHNISQLLRAHCLYEKDVHYVVQNNKVIIVDEFTGRLMEGRRFSEGLHQALEAKEGVSIERETQTLATITIQNYFRMYEKIAGMTGTAATEASEFKEIYDLDVLVIPTNKPCRRQDHNDRIFKTKREKYRAIIEEVADFHKQGQPVLLGSIAVESSELLSRMLKREKIPHNVLNAKHHQAEAEIIVRAGQCAAVTIATNMAGRGTDIRLGNGVIELGGLHVIGSERHDARRIDRQLRGRCARQGDPGSSRFYISLEDDLMRLFGSDRIAKLMERFGFKEGEELSHPWLNKSIENAQKKVEQQHFSIRKDTLKYDDVMNKQREVIYGRRKDILQTDNPRPLLFDYINTTIYDHIERFSDPQSENGGPVDKDRLLTWLQHTFPIAFDETDIHIDPENYDPEQLTQRLLQKVDQSYRLREKGDEPDSLRWFERHIMLTAHDTLWQQHLYAMDSLRQGIRLHAWAQKDPLVEYKQSAFHVFGELLERINDDIVNHIFRSTASLHQVQSFLDSLPQHEIHQLLSQFDLGANNSGQKQPNPQSVQEQNVPMQETAPASLPKGETYYRSQRKVGRNSPCPCKSGKKYKNCCGA